MHPNVQSSKKMELHIGSTQPVMTEWHGWLWPRNMYMTCYVVMTLKIELRCILFSLIVCQMFV